MIFVLIPQISIEAHKVEEVISLKNAVMLNHPMISLTHVGLEQHRCHVGMVGGTQRIANVVQ